MYQNEVLINKVKESILNCEKHMLDNKLYGDCEWTRQLKRFIGKLFDSNDYKFCAGSSEKEFENEWLYDMVWYRENEKGMLIEVPLVVESEWLRHLKDVKFDFEKLLLANSQLKLMICNCTGDKRDEYLNYFRKAIDVCPIVKAGDEFLIAILNLQGKDAYGFNFEVLKK